MAPSKDHVIPMIIGGRDVCSPESSRYVANKTYSQKADVIVQGADKAQCLAAVDSAESAFPSWAATDPTWKRALFLKLAELLRSRGSEIRSIMEEEISCGKLWSEINLDDSIGLVEELAALTTSERLGGSIPLMTSRKSQALVYTEPLGVVLGIAPWNAPLILGLRAVGAAVAAGNTAILKGSEASPLTHHFIANLFQEAGFPPGVVNFITHRPQDAADTFETLITHPAVRKCNFTGSTAVGRSIAARAGHALKPVLLELGGKNFAIVLEDADLDKACQLILAGAFLNNGQICMSTDTVLAVESIADQLKAKLLQTLPAASADIRHVISEKSKTRLDQLVADAELKGAKIHRSQSAEASGGIFPATLVDGLTPSMDFESLESFGPVFGLRIVKDTDEILKVVGSSSYGLSAAIFSTNHFRALQLAREMKIGAIHINGATVHDAPNLPHGGHGESGFGRFGGHWGLQEFVQTKTIIINE